MNVKLYLNGREVEASVYGRYEDDLQIDNAVFADTGEPLSNDEVMELYESADNESTIYEAWYENQACAAEFYADSLDDR